MVGPDARRQAAGHLEAKHGVSQRRACRVMSLHRSTRRYQSVKDEDSHLRVKLRELAAKKPRYGCPRLYEIIRRDGVLVNHKRIHRLYKAERLHVRQRRRRKRFRGMSVPLVAATRPNQRWSIDFVSDQLMDG